MLSFSAKLDSTPRDNCPSMAVVGTNGALACIYCGKFGEEAFAFEVGLGWFEAGDEPPTGGVENWMPAASIISADLRTIPCGSCNLAEMGKCCSFGGGLL